MDSTFCRPIVLNGYTRRYKTNFGNLFIVVNFDDENKPVEISAQIGKSGHELYSYLELICRLVSLCLQNNINRTKLINALRGTRSQYPFYHPTEKIQMLSIPDALGYELDNFSVDCIDKNCAIDYQLCGAV